MKPGDTKKLVYNAENSKQTIVGSQTSILGVEENVAVDDKHRVKHCLTTGANGTGKTQELLHVALQDTVKGHGLAIINPKGKLIDQYLSKAPDDRRDDLIYVNPSTDPIIGINVLEPYISRDSSVAAKSNQVELIVSNLIQLFKRRSDNWGDRFGRVLATLFRAGIEANIEQDENYTLLDIKRCITDKQDLKRLIDDTSDPELRSQLVSIKDDLTSRELEPLLRRLNDFTGNQVVRHIIASENSDIDFEQVVNQNKILLVDVREGEVGSTVTELLTSLVITKIWAAAQKRYYQRREVKEPFYLFVDELQSFPSEGQHFEEILSKAREYQLGCWLATQYLSQLPRKMQNAVANNCRTKLVFDPSGSEDLSRLSRMLYGIDQVQIARLGDYRAAIQTPDTKRKQKAKIVDTYPPWQSEDVDLQRIKKAASPATTTATTKTPYVGKGMNAGGKEHTELLRKAKEELEDRGLQVQILHQDAGDDKPDGHIKMPDGSTAYLEAEHGTLSKPAKVLKNLRRAYEDQRECTFVVKTGDKEKLQNILSDPVDRESPQDGNFSYYLDSDGEPFSDLDWIENTEYRIIEIGEDHQPIDPIEEELRDVDRTVLNCIKNGGDDIQKITSTTGLPNHKVNYSFKKLESLGLIQVHKPDEPVERVVDGQKRVFKVKIAELTETAKESLS
ncbi:type IV secretion system DNA-binding domain-containing protein [Halosimplex salinum]|uniref:type IV secretion system DNA-binding domain-containing protein n=1 Tax=Halosimplex salinum TaxID=1710538 RepID=UPI000F4A3DE1|nr:type IV secretion system DNA-binding domain-containing protein [Halosimplex salinum]